MNIAHFLLILTSCLIATILLTRLVLGELRRRSILDQPNLRSSHHQPTPRGGGIALVSVVAVAWTTIAAIGNTSMVHSIVVVAALGLAAISWLDDLRGLPITVRLSAQAVAVVSVLAVTPNLADPFDIGILAPLALGLAALAWLWFINLYNFMDGIDGITGVETATIGLGMSALAAMDTVAGSDGLRGAAMAGAGFGFLVWNWPRAKIFLGDVGSVPLGFLAGWLLLDSAAQGAWAPALILPAYYLGDATVTLIRRFVERKRFWEAHREHFYQQALGVNGRHQPVVLKIVGLNLLLVTLALLAVERPIFALAAAGAGTGALLLHFAALAHLRR